MIRFTLQVQTNTGTSECYLEGDSDCDLSEIDPEDLVKILAELLVQSLTVHAQANTQGERKAHRVSKGVYAEIIAEGRRSGAIPKSGADSSRKNQGSGAP